MEFVRDAGGNRGGTTTWFHLGEEGGSDAGYRAGLTMPPPAGRRKGALHDHHGRAVPVQRRTWTSTSHPPGSGDAAGTHPRLSEPRMLGPIPREEVHPEPTRCFRG